MTRTPDIPADRTDPAHLVTHAHLSVSRAPHLGASSSAFPDAPPTAPGAQPDARASAYSGPACPGPLDAQPGASLDMPQGAQPGISPSARPDFQPDAPPGTQAHARPGTWSGISPDARPGTPPDAQAAARPGTRSGASPDVQPDTPPDAQAVARPGTWSGTSPDAQSGTPPDTQVGTRSSTSPDAPTDARPVYLDYAATTPVDPRVLARMMPYLGDVYGNPASRSHAYGWVAEEAVELAREQVGALIGADPREIVWTSGATESNNLAIKGAAQFHAARGRHLVTVATEHKAVLDAMRELERAGCEVTVLPVREDGLLDPAAFEAALRPDTVLASVMLVNNETGVIQDIAALGALCRARGVLFHVDAAQAAGKVAIDLQSLPVDLMSLSAHKLYGPKGVGALYVRRKPRVRIAAQMHGGGHERGMRSGTLPVHQIAGMGEAFWLARADMAADNARILALRERLWRGLSRIDAVALNGHATRRAPGYLNVSFNYVEGESLLMGIKGVAVSSGSACTSASLEPSYVLRAMGRSDELAHSSVRFSLGRFTTEAEVDFTIAQIGEVVARLRAMSPLWDMVQAGVDLDAIQWAAH